MSDDIPETPATKRRRRKHDIKAYVEYSRLLLVQFKVVFILLLLFCAYETHSMMQWYYVHYTTMSAEGAAGFFSLVLFLLGNLKWAMEKAVE